MKYAASLAGVLVLLAGCGPQAETAEQAEARMQTETSAARTAIDSLAREFATHLNAGHPDVVAGFYTENAVAMPPNLPTASGRAAIQELFAQFVAMKAQLTLTTQSVSANGPIAIERGIYSVTMTPPGAPGPVTDTGKYLVHWHMVDGRWLIAEDIWNSDLPAVPAPPAPK